MIKVNLTPVKRKRGAKPLPSFVITMIIVTVIAGIVMAYLAYFFSSRLSDRKMRFAVNEKKIAELKEKIKAVENFEKLNATFQQRADIIEQLSKNRSVPVKLLDEISNILPHGIWLQAMTVSGGNMNVDGYGFTNSDIVLFVDNIKHSKLFTDAYLQESRSTEINKIPLYMFKLTFKIKG